MNSDHNFTDGWSRCRATLDQELSVKKGKVPGWTESSVARPHMQTMKYNYRDVQVFFFIFTREAESITDRRSTTLYSALFRIGT